jgi:hypothetical protein
MIMTEWEDLIFQAHCAIDILHSNFEDGGTLQRCHDDVLTMHLHDGSETTINLRPVEDLLKAIRGLSLPPSAQMMWP